MSPKVARRKSLHRSLFNVGISGITLTNSGSLIEPQWVEITQHEISIAKSSTPLLKDFRLFNSPTCITVRL